VRAFSTAVALLGFLFLLLDSASAQMMSTRAYTQDFPCDGKGQHNWTYNLSMRVSASHQPITRTVYIRKVLFYALPTLAAQVGNLPVYRDSDHSMLMFMPFGGTLQWQARSEDFLVPFVLNTRDSLTWSYGCVGGGHTSVAAFIFYTFSP